MSGMGRTPPGQTRERVFRFVRQRLLSGRPPTVREVQARFGFRSPQTAREHLERLVRDGLLAKEPGRARGYRLPGAGTGDGFGRDAPLRLVPVLGQVQAGAPVTAVEDLEGYVPIEERAGEDELFGLRVRGESMRDAGILPGDLAIVRRQDTARSGEIVVALLGDEATVKTLRRRGRRIELHPAHPDFPVIVPGGSSEDADEDENEAGDGDAFCLLGRVIEIRRRL